MREHQPPELERLRELERTIQGKIKTTTSTGMSLSSPPSKNDQVAEGEGNKQKGQRENIEIEVCEKGRGAQSPRKQRVNHHVMKSS